MKSTNPFGFKISVWDSFKDSWQKKTTTSKFFLGCLPVVFLLGFVTIIVLDLISS